MNNNHKPVIFLAFANDQDNRVGYLRNLPEEARRIREPLQRARSDGLCELVELANASADDIFRVFQSAEYRDRIAVFHYAGHANGYELLLESSEQKTTAANAEGLATFLGQQTGLQLVFLNGCSTQQHVKGLLAANVSSVIATSRVIDDNVAMQFSSLFYQGLAGGAGLQRAFKEAEAAIVTTQGGQPRGAYFGTEKTELTDTDRWPWDFHVRDGAEKVADWSLPEAAGDPLFGLPSLSPGDLPPCPFQHLHWFTKEHAEIFFGRGHQIRELYDLISTDDAAPIVLLYGQSGVGKSSVLSAGLIPRLSDSCEVFYVRRDKQAGLLKTLKDVLAHGGNDVTMKSIHFGADWMDLEEKLDKPLVVIVDQIEECYSRPNPELEHEMDDFLNEIQDIFANPQERPRGKLILGFRKEWLAEIEGRLQERRLPCGKVFLEKLGRRGIVEAVLGPSITPRLQQQYHLTIDDSLAQVIADNLSSDKNSAIAPTLQVLLTKMWQNAVAKNESNPHFDLDLYRDLKSKGLLLQDFLDQQLKQLHNWQEDVIDSGLALDLLAFHTTPMGTADVRLENELPDTYQHRKDVLDELVQRCKDLYLLVDLAEDNRSATSGTRLSHDSLAPLVRALFEDSDRPGQRARRILNNRIVDWNDNDSGTALDAQDLKVVELGLTGSRSLSSAEQKLLEHSRKQIAKHERTKRLFQIGAIASLIAIVALSVVNFNSWLALKKQKAVGFDLARGVVDEFYVSVANNELVNQPGMTDLRLELLSKGTKFYEHFVSTFGKNKESKHDVAIARFNLGLVHHEQGSHQQALVNFLLAREIQTELMDVTESQPNRSLELSNTLTEIGNVNFDLEEYTEAIEHYQQAMDIRNQLLENTSNDDEMFTEIQMRLADAKMNVGNTQEKQTLFESAEQSYFSAQEMRRSVLTQLSVIDDGSEEATSSMTEKRVGVHRQLGFGDQNFKGLYEEMAESAWLLFDEAEKAQDESKTQTQQEIAKGYELQALDHCNKSIKHLDIVLKAHPNDGLARSRLADCRVTIARLGNQDESASNFKSALKEFETLIFYYPTVTEYKQQMAACLIESADIDGDKLKVNEAIEILDAIQKGSQKNKTAQKLLDAAKTLR